MEETVKTKCPRCHTELRASDYFCFNCGYNLKPKPPGTDKASLMGLFAKTFLLPPLGLYWGALYLKQSDRRSKIVGWLAIVGTIILLTLITIWTKHFADELNQQLDTQMTSLSF